VIKARTLKRRDRNGKPIVVHDVRLRTPGGKVYTRTFRTKKAAEAFEDSEQTDQRRGAWIDPRFASMTVKDLAARWMESNPAKRSGTRSRDDTIIRLHIVPTFGARPIGSVTQPDVQGLVNSWPQAPRTIKRQYGVLRALFAYAVAAEYLTRTPCQSIKLPEARPLRRRLPATDELDKLASELGPGHALMMRVGVITGLRWGEVAGLRVGSLDLLRHEVHVMEARTRDLKGDGITAAPKSQAGVRSLNIPEGLSALLAQHLAARGVNGANPDALVFTGSRGGPLNYSHWRQRVWEPACKRAMLAGLTFHDLRRLNATAMVADGVDLKTAQTRFGHSDPRLTLAVYAQATTDADRSAADALGARFLPRDGRAMDVKRSRRRFSPATP
jgi:integrase